MNRPAKYCFIATHSISVDSNLNTLYVSDEKNITDPIRVFDNGEYELLVKINESQKVDSLIYQSDYEEDLLDDFMRKAKERLNQALNRLQTAFGLIKIYKKHSITTQKDPEFDIKCFDYESKITSQLIMAEFCEDFYATCSISKYVKLQDIKNILGIEKENIDEYINRFVSLENLNNDPVLHLITLFSLYEYIKKTKGGKLADCFTKTNKQHSNKKLESVFRSTRNLVAHGFAGGKSNDEKKTREILEEFLGESDKLGRYSFNRYNETHMKLVNEVINESQILIDQYLRKMLWMSE